MNDEKRLPKTLSRASDKEIAIDPKLVIEVEVLGVQFRVPIGYSAPFLAGPPDGSAQVAMIFYPNPESPTSVVAIKVKYRTPTYSLAEEVIIMKKNFDMQNLVLNDDLSALYEERGLEAQKGAFPLGVGHLVSATIVGNPNPMDVFTYVAESDEKIVVITQVGPGKEYSTEVHDQNVRSFIIISGSV